MTDDSEDLETNGGPATDEVHGATVDQPSPSPNGSATDAASDAAPVRPSPAQELGRPTEVVGSPVVKTASRTVTPFVFAFGVYLTLFGTSLPGGAFQGGVVVASAVVLIAMAFGFEPTQAWLDERALAGLFLLGAGIFAAVAFGAILLGGELLQLVDTLWILSVENMVKLVEVAIAALVAGVVIGLIVWLAGGFEGETA